MVSRALGNVLIVLVVGTVGARVWGEAADPLAPARDLVRAFEYDAAMEQLEAVVADGSMGARTRIAAIELIALVHLTEGRPEEVRASFRRLLELDPGHVPSSPEFPPEMAELFSEAREGFEPEQVVELSVRAPVPSEDGTSVTIEAEVGAGAGGVDRAVASIRGGAAAGFRQVDMAQRGSRFSAEVSAPAEGALAYFVEVLSPSGHVLGREGAPDAPLEWVPEDVGGDDDPPIGGDEARATPWYGTWWFWTAVGAVVAAGTVTAIVLTLPEEAPPDGSWGAIRLPMR